MDINQIKSQIVKDQGISPSAVDIFSTEKGTYALIYNSRQITKAISDKDIEAMKQMKGSAIEKIYARFGNNEKVKDQLTNYLLEEKDMENFDEIVDYINSHIQITKDVAEDETILKKHGKIEGYLIRDGKIQENAIFSAVVNVQKQGKCSRCFVDEVETESEHRGNGVAGRVLRGFLPVLCANSYVSNIVLQAGAYDVDSEKTTQAKLEEFYKNCGFTRVCEDENLECVKKEDFSEGYPVYVKPVDFEKIY